MSASAKKQRNFLDYLGISAIGVAMGAADVVPGVSGGTMAFILGVYEELLATIKSFNLTFLKLLLKFQIKAALEHVNWKFLLALGLGLGLALFSLAHLVSWLLEHHPIPLFAFFFGLVLASIVSVSAHVRWNIITTLACIFGALIAYFVVRMIPVDMPHDPLTLFWCAGIAIMAMILPGISGSFLLFILGQYKYILDAVKTLDFLVLLPVAAGIAVGIMLFARLLTWLLKHQRRATITMLVGFMIGSLWKIWPFRITLETAVKPNGEIIPIREAVVWPDFGSKIFWLSLALCIAGYIIIALIERIAGKTPSSR